MDQAIVRHLLYKLSILGDASSARLYVRRQQQSRQSTATAWHDMLDGYHFFIKISQYYHSFGA